MDYTGYRELLQDNEIAQFYSGDYSNLALQDNEYIFIGKEIYRVDNGNIERVNYPTITSRFAGTLKPRNREQIAAIDMLQLDKSKIKLICGKPGTGKTMLLAASAFEKLEQGEIDKIVYIRNNIQVKDTDQLGSLPGDIYDKMLPYLGPLMDHAGGEAGIIGFISSGQLEVIPLGFLRGRSIRNSIIFCTEAENLSKQQIQLIMGRIDEGSELYMDADIKQRDRTTFEKSKGIETMIDRLKGQPLFSYIHLEKTERSPMSALADLLDD